MKDSANPNQISEADVRILVSNILSIKLSNKDVDLCASLMNGAYSIVGRRVPEWYIFGGDRDSYHFNRAVEVLQPLAAEDLDVRSIMIDELKKRRT